jgi:hypothetical protein
MNARAPELSDAPVLQRVRHGRHGEVLRRRDELERAALVELRLALLARLEQGPARVVQLVVQPADERQRVVGQDLVIAVLLGGVYLDAHVLVNLL